MLLADAREESPTAVVEEDQVASRLVGLRSWSRRQVVIVPDDDPAGTDEASLLSREPVAWVALEDRAAGRTNVQWSVRRDLPGREELADALLAWADAVGGSFARHRGVQDTNLTADSAPDDAGREGPLRRAGYEHVRTWLHMERPVDPAEATSLPAPREGVRVRQVQTHASGLPVAHDVRTVHRMLEESFEDHFNSYRESFAEFAARLVEGPGTQWDHWWIAEVLDEDGTWLPGGGLVADSMPATADKGEGTYLEYVGVHRSARGRGVAKALLHAAIADAAARGRTRVGLEVDAQSPTGADGLYRSMGWETASSTEAWHRTVPALPSRLVGDDENR